MGIDIIQMHKPLWTSKLSDEKLQQYLDALNELELKGGTDSKLLLDTAETWYHSPTTMDNLMHLTLDIYKEAAVRWYSFAKKNTLQT